MFKRILAISICLALSLSIVADAVDKDHFTGFKVLDYATPAEALVANGIMQGDENGNLNLDDNVTRSEFSKMYAITSNINYSGKVDFPFVDVLTTDWEYLYVAACFENGIINGTDDTHFSPNDNITYEQAIKMVTAPMLYGNVLYPADYIACAIKYDLLDNIKATIGDKLTRGDIVNLLYNLLAYIESSDDSDDYSYSLYNSYSKGSGIGAGGGSAPTSGMVAYTESVEAVDGMTYMPDPYFKYDYFDTEGYTKEDENVFKSPLTSPLSTFSLDTDTASYSNMRRFITNGDCPKAGSIRTEELLNYFDYDYTAPTGDSPFAITTEVSECPWNSENSLVRIGVKAKELDNDTRAEQNLVFLIDTSGSMFDYNKLPLIKRALKMLLQKLDERDTISIVTYASGTSVALSGAKGNETDKILNCIDGLYASGSTNGEAGLQLAYEQAEEFKCSGNNRIILCTDGDFNVGITSNGDLKDIVSSKRDSGIFLSILGFGMGNYKDDKLEIMADNGNGNYYYVDSMKEAKRIFVDKMTSTLYTVAKDVKIQVEFNPAVVGSYRLIGYENRLLNAEDFDNDAKDAGEVGAGACVTALYEIAPVKDQNSQELHYQQSTITDNTDELMFVKVRYKNPNEDNSNLLEYTIPNSKAEMSADMSFAASIAELAMILNGSEYLGDSTFDTVLELANAGLGEDSSNIRHEFVQLVELLPLYIN